MHQQKTLNNYKGTKIEEKTSWTKCQVWGIKNRAKDEVNTTQEQILQNLKQSYWV